MKKILLTLLCVSLICASVFAFLPFGNKTATSTINEAELRAVLESLAPTEAEAKAIAELRKNSLSPSSVPVEVETVDDDSVWFTIAFQFLSGKEADIRQITAHPAMSWSSLPVAKQQLPIAESSPGMFSSSVSTQMPMQVRFLEQTTTEKLLSTLSQTYKMLSVSAAPSMSVANGNEEMMNDTTKIPFVTSVLPVVADYATSYQPVIQFFDKGHRITAKATLLQDGSYRLKSQVEVTALEKVDTYKLLYDGTPDVVVSRNSRTVVTTSYGVTIQNPSFRSFHANIPDIVIPEGMSLLVAFPGAIFPGKEDHGAFLLITPRKLSLKDTSEMSDEMRTRYTSSDVQEREECVRYQSENTKTIADEWERFWMLDEPPHAPH